MATTLARMYAAARRGELVDLAVTCATATRQKTFGVHFAVVAAECGYFRTMHSTLVGAGAKTHAFLECEPSTFERVLECVYLGTLPGLDATTAVTALDATTAVAAALAALDVAALGVFLDCDVAVKAACARLESAVTHETALELWERARALGSNGTDAARVALRAVARHLPRIARTERFARLARDDVEHLLSSDELCVRDETHVSNALRAWCDANAGTCCPCSALEHVVRRGGRAAREAAPLRGALVVCTQSETPHFLTESDEWVDAPFPPLTSHKGAGLVCYVGGATYAIGTVHNYGIEYHSGGTAASRAWSTYSVAFCRPQASCAVLGSMIYIVGGISGIRACEDVDVHDVSTGLKGKFYMRVARRKCCAAATPDGVLVVGGIGSSGDVLAHAELLAACAQRPWRATPSVPPALSPRAAAACAAIGTRVYVAGGLGSMRADTSTAECYDAEARTWLALPPMPRSRSLCAGVAMGGAFYVVGGFEYGVEATSFFRLDVETLEWTTHDAPALGECSAAYVEQH
jgi:hypothetical protein